MKTLLLLCKLLLPLGVAILSVVFILKSCAAVSDFTAGFFEGMSFVFIVAGAATLLGAVLDRRSVENGTGAN